MTWTDFYLICFIVGFTISLVSLLVGVFHVDLPGNWDNFLHPAHGVGHMQSMGLHGAHGLHGHGHLPGHPGGGFHVSPINFSTVMTFLAWFGGAGALLTAHFQAGLMLALVISSFVGLMGASLVFLFLVKVLLPHDRSMDPADYDMVGVLGSITVPVREHDGTGEMVYVQDGTRKSVAVRADDSKGIPSGEEVVVTRFEEGVAYVRRWVELEQGTSENFTGKQN